MYDFKFNVGDRVYIKVGYDDALAKCKFGERSLPLSFLIVERHSQECPGGVQGHYHVSNVSQKVLLNAIEIGGLWDDLDIAPFVDAIGAYNARQEAISDAHYERLADARRAAKKAQALTKE